MLYNKTTSSLKENIRGQSMGNKNAMQGLRSIEPKFFNNIGNHIPYKTKDSFKNDRQPLIVRKENIVPVISNVKTPCEKKILEEGSENMKKTENHKFSQINVNSKVSCQTKENYGTDKVDNKNNLLTCFPRGFHNIGNTCYMNSTLQCLLHQPKFNYGLVKQLKKKGKGKQNNTSYELYSVIKQLNQNANGSALNLKDLKKAIGKQKPIFFGSAQHDAQEFLTSVLEILNNELTRVTQKAVYRELDGDPSKKSLKSLSDQWWAYYLARDNSFICDLFQGQLISTVTCAKCRHKSVSFDNFWGIPLAFRRNNSIKQMLIGSWGVEENVDSYYCGKCKTIRNCMKKIQIFRHPQILVVQLKRFDFSKGYRKKRNDQVSIDLQLQLSGVMSKQASNVKQSQYTLKGVVHHYGQAQFGHYNAQIFNHSDQKWYCMDDSRTDRCSKPSSSKSAYLFFYQRNS